MSKPYMLIVALDIRSTIRTIISAKSSNALIMRYPCRQPDRGNYHCELAFQGITYTFETNNL